MTTPENTENPDEGTDAPKEAPAKKTTRRTPRKQTTKAPDDSQTLKDTQKVNQQASEQLGSSVSPGRSLYQTSQFDVQSSNPDVLRHLAYPSEAAVKAAEASDEALRSRHKDNS